MQLFKIFFLDFSRSKYKFLLGWEFSRGFSHGCYLLILNWICSVFIGLLGNSSSKGSSKVFSRTSCSKQGHLWGQTVLWGILPSQSMKNLKQGDCKTTLGYLFQSLTVLMVKISYRASILDFSTLSVVSLLLVLSQVPLWWAWLLADLLVGTDTWRSTQNHLFSRLNQPSSLCLYSQDKCSGSLSILVAPWWLWVYCLYCGGPKGGALDHVWNNKLWAEVAISSLIYWQGFS